MENSIKSQIPNWITASNLFCGCLAILSIADGEFQRAAYLVFAAALLDFFDGMAARLLKVHSELGKQLDSLADVVTFGVVPGYLLYKLLGNTVFCEDGTCWKAQFLPYLAFLITIQSAYRLAKFNIDTRQSHSFIGVPTPANALVIVSLVLVPADSFLNSLLQEHLFLTALIMIMSYLLTAELPLFALKFKNFSWQDNKIRYVFIFSCLLLLLFLRFEAVPFLLILYITLSIFSNYKNNEIQS